MGDPAIMRYDSTVYEKLKAADAFAMELDPTAVNPMVLMQMMVMPDSINTEDYLDSTDKERVDSVFRKRIGYSYRLMERLYPIVVATMLMEKPASANDSGTNWVMPDVYLKTRAEWLNKEVIALEVIETQIKALASIPLKRQYEELLSATEEGTSAADALKPLFEIYKQQDIEALYKSTSEEGAWEGADSFLLEGRNREMVQTMMGEIHARSLFVAVGAAHLGGDAGLIALLRENGYDVNPVKFNFLTK